MTEPHTCYPRCHCAWYFMVGAPNHYTWYATCGDQGAHTLCLGAFPSETTWSIMACVPGVTQLIWNTRFWHFHLEISHIPGYFSSWFCIIDIWFSILFCETHFLAHSFLSRFRALFSVFTVRSCKGVQKLFGNHCLRAWYRSQCDIWHTRLGNTVAKMQQKVAKHVVVIF